MRVGIIDKTIGISKISKCNHCLLPLIFRIRNKQQNKTVIIVGYIQTPSSRVINSAPSDTPRPAAHFNLEWTLLIRRYNPSEQARTKIDREKKTYSL